MSRAPTLAEVFDRLHESLSLEAVHLERSGLHALPTGPPTGAFPTLVGHLNLVQPNLIQVLGPTEVRYWEDRGDHERAPLLDQLFRDDLFGLIVTDDETIPPDLLARARREGVPLLRTPQSCERVISTLRHALGRDLAARVVLHGVFLDVLGVGVLLAGASSVGKSELALELITRGHSLVADDAPEFSRPAPDAVEGRSPPLLKDFLEVRGLGVLNIRSMYGDAAIRHYKLLQLIIHLEPLTDALRDQLERLGGNLTTTDVLGVPVTAMTLPVAPGRNLAVMVEAAVRTYLLARRGYHAGDDLMRRQERAIARDRDEECD